MDEDSTIMANQAVVFRDVTSTLKVNMLPNVYTELGLDIKKSIVGPVLWSKFMEAGQFLYASNWSSCDEVTKILMDITWEHLNTGHWKDVNITWRHLYTYVCFFKVTCEYSLWRSGDQTYGIKDAVKTCDMGLLMGAPVLDNILNTVVRELQRIYSSDYKESTEKNSAPSELLSSSAAPVIHSQFEVKRLKCPPLFSFKQHFVDTETPAIIEKCMDHWPAMSNRRWNIPYIKKLAGCRTVPIELGSKYTEDDWSQSLMTIESFIDKYVVNPDSTVKGYLAQHQLFDQIPELQKDFIIPEYCSLGEKEEVDVNAWFGPCGTISPLHQDPKHNFLAQIVGQKYIKLYSTEHTAKVYPLEGQLMSNTSQVDVENPDYETFPLLKDAPYLECILKEGEMLYIPPKYWHYVRSLSVSFSASFWWE